jgi:hypothetical protein
MKLSELTTHKATVDAVVELRNTRRDIARCLANIDEHGDASCGDGFTEIPLSGEAVQIARRALEQQQLDIEQELIGLGVEIDEPADAPEDDDDERADDASGDLEEAA